MPAALSHQSLMEFLRSTTLPPNLWIVAINIHAGENAMKTLRRSGPNVRKARGGRNCSRGTLENRHRAMISAVVLWRRPRTPPGS